jgi:hypothetical protein
MMNPSANEDTPPSRAITREEEQAFVELSLTPGNWWALLPFPLVSAVRKELGPDREQDLLDAAMFPLPDLGRFLGKNFVSGSTIFTETEASVREQVFSIKRDRFLREYRPNARALLAWHLASDYNWDQRRIYFKVIEAMPQNKSWLNDYNSQLLQDLAELRAKIDLYLPHDRYQLDPLPKPIPGPNPAEVARALGPPFRRHLAIIPLLQWLQPYDRSEGGIWKDIKQALNSATSSLRGSNQLAKWLTPPWHELLGRVDNFWGVWEF